MTSHIESWAADRGICSHGSQRCKCPVCECFAELSDLRAAVAHAAAQLGAAEAKTGDAPESARAHFREAVRTIARTLPPSEVKFDRAAVWGELREMDRLHEELELLRRYAERWRAIE